MPEIVADPPSSSCSRLFSALGIAAYQWLSPDLLLLRAHGAGVLRQNATSPSGSDLRIGRGVCSMLCRVGATRLSRGRWT